MPLKSAYLDPLVLARIGHLKVRAEKVVEGFLSGLHQSPYRGTSLEFAQHRQYVMGDEIRHIDWKIYARSDRFFVKQFEQETNLQLHLMIDASGSMAYKGAQSPFSKFDYAATLAASLSYLTLSQGDSAGLTIFGGPAVRTVPARSSYSHLSLILDEIEKTVPKGETSWHRSLNEIIPSFQKRGLFILFSDLLGPEEEILKVLKLLAFKKHEVAVIHLLDEDEKDFPFGSAIRFNSLEDSRNLVLDAGDFREEYLEAVAKLLEFYRIGFRKAGVRYQFHTTKDSPDRVLRLLLK